MHAALYMRMQTEMGLNLHITALSTTTLNVCIFDML